MNILQRLSFIFTRGKQPDEKRPDDITSLATDSDHTGHTCGNHACSSESGTSCACDSGDCSDCS